MERNTKTKIIATLGPASDTPQKMRAMMRAGVDVFRINGAHGGTAEHRRFIFAVRNAAKKENFPAAVMLDLPGPKFRIGKLMREPVKLKVGGKITLFCGASVQKDARIPVPDAAVARSVRRGGKIFLNDGIVKLTVLKVKGREIFCRVSAGGEIRTHKGMNLPNVRLAVPSLTKEDKKLAFMAANAGVDYLALSFVRSAKCVTDLRRLLRNKAPHMGIVAKIEKPEALKDLDAIIAASDAVMVARGDLGIEMPFDRVPIIQRDILTRCLVAGKPSITATQMLESMVEAKTPTRAEATDVAQAVWEGSDAVMLSAETSIGKNPVEAVKAMSRIAKEAEKKMPQFDLPRTPCSDSERQAQVISCAAGFIAESVGAKAIVTPTRSGRTALFVSRDRPCVMIIAPTEDEKVARRMNLYWGVRPLAMPRFKTVDQLLTHAEKVAKGSRLIKKGDKIVITSGAHGTKDDITRLVEVRTV